jgi:hypothetical protein
MMCLAHDWEYVRRDGLKRVCMSCEIVEVWSEHHPLYKWLSQEEADNFIKEKRRRQAKAQKLVGDSFWKTGHFKK